MQAELNISNLNFGLYKVAYYSLGNQSLGALSQDEGTTTAPGRSGFPPSVIYLITMVWFIDEGIIRKKVLVESMLRASDEADG